MQADKIKGSRLRRILGFSSSLFLMMLLFMIQSKPAEASASITVKEINYDNSTITLQLGTEDTHVYLSDPSILTEGADAFFGIVMETSLLGRKPMLEAEPFTEANLKYTVAPLVDR